MNQTPMTTPPSRHSTHRAANTLTSLWADTLPDTEWNNSHKCSYDVQKANGNTKNNAVKLFYEEDFFLNKVTEVYSGVC